MVQIGNFYYFLYIGIFFVVLLSLYFILKRFQKETQYKVLLGLAFANFALHFLKLLFKPYCDDMPGQIRFITFCNICAITTMLMPWVYLYRRNKTLNNYIYFIGVVGGLGAILFPTEAIGKSPFTFDTIRFYICHISLITIPILMAKFKIFEPDYKKAWTIPIFFIAIEIVIFLNEIFLIKVGLVDSTWTEFFDRDVRNTSFVFGPGSSFDGIAKIITVFVPKFLKTNIFNIEGLTTFYFPILWLVIPAFIYLPIVGLILEMPFVYKDIKKDYKEWRMKKC